MKKIFLGLSLFSILILTSCASKQPVNSMFEELKKDDESLAITLPGWMIRKGFNLAAKGADMDDDVQKLRNISGGVKKLRVLVNPNSDRDIKSFTNKYMPKLEKNGFDNYAAVKNKDANVMVYAKEKGSSLKGLLFFFSSDSEIGIIHLKTDIPTSEFEKIDFSFSQNKEADKEDKNVQ